MWASIMSRQFFKFSMGSQVLWFMGYPTHFTQYSRFPRLTRDYKISYTSNSFLILYGPNWKLGFSCLEYFHMKSTITLIFAKISGFLHALVWIVSQLKNPLEVKCRMNKCQLMRSLHIILLTMKRQAYYLPNLNTLLAQNRQLARHRQRLKLASSEYNQAALEPTEFKREPSPFEKRQRREQLRENSRMSKAIDVCSPTVPHHVPKQEEAYNSLKQRIRKFTTESSRVTYKFEKSLAELEKKRQNQEQPWSHRTRELQANPLQEISSPKALNINSTIKVKTTLSQHSQNDIFYQDGDSLCLNPAAPRKLTLNYPRSLTPHNFIHLSQENRGKTEKIKFQSRERLQPRVEKVKTIGNHQDQQLNQSKRYRSELYGNISKSIKQILLGKISRTLNPETLLKRRQQKLADLEIISIPPVS